MPPDILQFMTDLADDFQLRIVDPKQPLVREIGFRTRETEGERKYWRGCEKLAVRYFLGVNPAYHEGRGLLSLVPFTPAALSNLATRLLRDRTASEGERAIGRLEQWPVVSRFMRARSIRKQLVAVPLFSGLDDESLDALVAGATELSLPAASYLFRQGAEGEALYIVSRGVVSVLIDSPEGEQVIDQLGRGAVFGEVALLSGARRTDSIRTVTRSTLIRISPDVIRALMDRNEGVRKAIWNALALRFLEDHRRRKEAAHVHPASLRASIEEGQHEDLLADAPLRVDRDRLLLLLKGKLVVERDDGISRVFAAPCVVEVGATDRIVAQTNVRVIRRLGEASL